MRQWQEWFALFRYNSYPRSQIAEYDSPVGHTHSIGLELLMYICRRRRAENKISRISLLGRTEEGIMSVKVTGRSECRFEDVLTELGGRLSISL